MSKNSIAFVVCMHLRFYQGTFKILSLHLGAFIILSFRLTFTSLHMMCIEVTVFALHPLGFCELYGSVIRCPLVIPYLFPCFFSLSLCPLSGVALTHGFFHAYSSRALDALFCFYFFLVKIMLRNNSQGPGFPGALVVKTPPASAGDTGVMPGPERSHMLQGSS